MNYDPAHVDLQQLEDMGFTLIIKKQIALSACADPC